MMLDVGHGKIKLLTINLDMGIIALRCLSVPYSTHMRFIMDYHMIIAPRDSYAVACTCTRHTFQSQSGLIVVGQAT